MRSFDQRSHSYLGYALRVRGPLVGEARERVVAIGKAAQEKHQFRAGDLVSGKGEQVLDTRTEAADPHEASGPKVSAKGGESVASPPAFLGSGPALGPTASGATGDGRRRPTPGSA